MVQISRSLAVSRKSRKRRKSSNPNGSLRLTPETLLTSASLHLQRSQPDDALIDARHALALLRNEDSVSATKINCLPALNLLGEIEIERGDENAAREYFIQAVAIDSNGEIEDVGGGAEKFFWLAQLCENGGKESIEWFDKGCQAVRREIERLEGTGEVALLTEKKEKLARALCGAAEVYMTDLSWEEDAEIRCETYISEALLAAPDNPESLQSLASLRISQLNYIDARQALSRSMDIWKDLKPEDSKVPDFPVRISLARLLMEVEMEGDAMEVLERLVAEEDTSVEAWYLGGWCLHLMANAEKKTIEASQPHAEETESVVLLQTSRDWLQNSLRLYNVLEYEDERLRDHAVELVEALNSVLGSLKESSDGKYLDGILEDDESESEDDKMELM